MGGNLFLDATVDRHPWLKVFQKTSLGIHRGRYARRPRLISCETRVAEINDRPTLPGSQGLLWVVLDNSRESQQQKGKRGERVGFPGILEQPLM